MERISTFLGNIVDRILPASQRRLSNAHHFVCCGKVHVKFATMSIIIIRIIVTLSLFAYITVNGYYVNYWLDMLYEIVEFLSLLCLIVGYLKEDSKWMLPYMGVEFTWLLITLIVYVISFTALFNPSKVYSWLTTSDDPTQEGAKSYAFWHAIRTLIFAILLATELSVLLACSRYFDDEKERIKENRGRPIILNVNEDTRNNAVVFMDDVDDSQTPSKTSKTNSGESSRGFGNPNFTLENDSEDEMDENDWHRKGKKASILK